VERFGSLSIERFSPLLGDENEWQAGGSDAAELLAVRLDFRLPVEFHS
jgi:hypothetical protein